MAGLKGYSASAENALAAATAETLLQLVAATNKPVKVKGWGVYFDGTSVTAEPVQVTVNLQSSAGTSSAGTVTPLDSHDARVMETTALVSFTAEPTTGVVLDMAEVHPQGSYEVIYPDGWERWVASGARIGIIATAPAIVNARAKFLFEE